MEFVFIFEPVFPIDPEGLSNIFTMEDFFRMLVRATSAPSITMLADFVFPMELAIFVAGTETVSTSPLRLGLRIRDESAETFQEKLCSLPPGYPDSGQRGTLSWHRQ
jgi:hypothetical protein